MYEALSSRLSLAHSRISTGLAGALNRLSLGPVADRRQSAQRVGLTQIALELCDSSQRKGRMLSRQVMMLMEALPHWRPTVVTQRDCARLQADTVDATESADNRKRGEMHRALDSEKLLPCLHFAVQCLRGNSHRKSRSMLMCSALALQQITCEIIGTVLMCEVDSLCTQQYHQLQRAQSCQSKPNRPHQQR